MSKTFIIPRLIMTALFGFMLVGFGPCQPDLNPIVFIHGGSGSASQFDSQALRFASNGYPRSYLTAVEYDSGSISEILDDVHAAIDARIAELQAATGREQVDLMGHSLGGFVSLTYMANPERAQNIAHYVSIDSGSSEGSAVPNGVNALALWAGGVERQDPPYLPGATNVTIPNQEHIEVATSEESFFEMYHFFRGKAPCTTKILPQPWPLLSGRAVSFPDNNGLDGATVEIWLVDGDTGERIGSAPQATYAIGPEGYFGPFKAWYGANYEFAVMRDPDIDVRYFFEPFVRSDQLLRLNVALELAPFIEQSDNHVALTITRDKEFWGDKGAENDVLAINGTDVVNEVTAPSGAVGAASAAFFLFDVGSDGISNLTYVPFPFPFVGFLTGADLFIPTDPPGTVSVETVPRGDFGAARTVNVPNIPSTQTRLVVRLNDFEQ